MRMVVERLKKTAVQEAQRLNSLSGKRIRWIFADGPIPQIVIVAPRVADKQR